MEPRMTRHAVSGKKPAGDAGKEGREIQAQVDARDREAATQKPAKEAVQAGQRDYPANFPPQHLAKPGHEADLEEPPHFDAPDYQGSAKLMDMVALITGADSGIGRAIAVLYAREGADIAIVYLEEHGDADDTKRAVEAEGRRCITIAGDVADLRFCEAAVEETIRQFGQIDVLVNNAAFQEHAERLEDLTE